MDNEPILEIDEYGSKRWKLHGKLHRVDGPAVERANGDKRWYLNGKRHRVDGPAIEYSGGEKIWYKHGECHREDGPAYEGENGDKDWYLHGKHYFFDRWLEANTFISEEEKVMLKLIHG
jgi:hypothetical protein